MTFVFIENLHDFRKYLIQQHGIPAKELVVNEGNLTVDFPEEYIKTSHQLFLIAVQFMGVVSFEPMQHEVKKFSRFDFDINDGEKALTSLKPSDFEKVFFIEYDEKNIKTLWLLLGKAARVE